MEIETVVEATTRKNEDGTVSLWIDGHSTRVSSGSMFGCATDSQNPAQDVIKYVKRHNEWLDSIQNEDGTVSRQGHTFKVRITLDGKPLPYDAKVQSLQAFL